MKTIQTDIIYNENCSETIKKLPNNLIDAVITSPPYNMRLRIRNGQYTVRENTEHFSKKYSQYDDAMPIQEYYNFHVNILKQLLEKTKIIFWNIQIVTGSKEAIFKIIGELGEYIKDIIVWDKGYGQPAMHANVLNSCYELIIIFESNKSKGRTISNCFFERGTLNNIWRIPRSSKKIIGHGAVFPEDLVATILNNFTKKGDVIYDPFMGTGTVARVCKDLGRHYIGSEISEEYCRIAEDRLGQQNLF